MIRSAQGVLGYLGYGDGPERIVADGSLGEHTQAALRSFQQDQGIYVDGVLGPRTWATLHDRADESGLCGQPTSTSSDTGNANVEPGTDGGTYVESDNGNDSTGYRPYRSASKQQEYLDNTAYDIWLHYDSFGGTWSSLCYNVLHNPTVTYGWLTTPAPQSRYGYSASDAPGIALSLYNRCVVAYGQP
jgi:peptidoglycan hydrolase-like protein with peptidoglycan-binding domain